MDEIERKLRMFYVMDAKDRWDHLLIVADECEERGDTELAEALRVFGNNMRFPTSSVAMHSGELAFSFGTISDGNLASVIRNTHKYRVNNPAVKRGGVIFTSADQ